MELKSIVSTADSSVASPLRSFPTNSHDTALCVIPPPSQCGAIDRLRQLYDKAYGIWPPHINLIYPFVAPDQLPRAQQQIQSCLHDKLESRKPFLTTLNQAGLFKQRKNSNIFLHEDRTGCSSLESVRSLSLQALGQPVTPSSLHLTIGQSENDTTSSGEFLLAKAQLLPNLCFRFSTLAILIREPSTGTNAPSHMRLWGMVEFAASDGIWRPRIIDPRISSKIATPSCIQAEQVTFYEPHHLEATSVNYDAQLGSTFYHDEDEDTWKILTNTKQNKVTTTNLSVSSYNALIGSEYPQERDRDPLLIRNILSDAAMADVIVLQEISDEFLSYLLNDSEVQRRYPFTSHGPPSQPDIEPLPNLRNIVILSRYSFRWKLLPFRRRHKGALIAIFEGILKPKTTGLTDIVVVGLHLTCGLTDGAVAAKKAQLHNLLDHLSRNHTAQPWILAGDFNIPTSAHTINAAILGKRITHQTTETLASMESAFGEFGLLDSWFVARLEGLDYLHEIGFDELFEGEEGATFDPRNNVLAAGTSTTSHDRPQRYDRILVRPQGFFRIRRFNHFGLPEIFNGVQLVASDHSGVRTVFQVVEDGSIENAAEDDAMQDLFLEHRHAPISMSNTSDLKSVLSAQNVFPSKDEAQSRQRAFTLLKQVILGIEGPESSGPDIPMVVVAVGSFALGVWTADSDIDCLCIGVISSKTFFKLARHRLAKATDQGVRMLRKVEAKTGTMLELSVNGIAMDLQYCPATRIVERWSEFQDFPTSDPIFNLPVFSLRKLKPYRDLLYIQRTLPSLATFRLAYRGIKLWATQRGIYSSKFGYLGGIHITLMLTWICKRLAFDVGSIGVAEVVASFFHHFAQFDWTNRMLFDCFFHKQKPRYHRSGREPMVILGYHAPNFNVAHTSTLPGLLTLAKEFGTADTQLSIPGMTWEKFFDLSNDSSTVAGLGNGATNFLNAHPSFVKIDIQYWGRTLAKGKGLVGWVESRCLSLVVDINKAFPELELRIWPSRFTDSDATDESSISDYHGCYLIGLSRAADAVSVPGNDDKQFAKQSLEKITDRFLTHLKTDERKYDSSTCWIDVSLVKAADVNGMRLDDREWGEYTADMEPDSEDEEEPEDDLDGSESIHIERTLPQRPKPTATPVSSSKLRPASDILHRLRWDPSLDPSEYIIGYEDRFLGAKETNLEKWKTEQTDEEFIPQHRILYFKKKGGYDGKGELVWERMTRMDRIFGSGAGGGD